MLLRLPRCYCARYASAKLHASEVAVAAQRSSDHFSRYLMQLQRTVSPEGLQQFKLLAAIVGLVWLQALCTRQAIAERSSLAREMCRQLVH